MRGAPFPVGALSTCLVCLWVNPALTGNVIFSLLAEQHFNNLGTHILNSISSISHAAGKLAESASLKSVN